MSKSLFTIRVSAILFAVFIPFFVFHSRPANALIAGVLCTFDGETGAVVCTVSRGGDGGGDP